MPGFAREGYRKFALDPRDLVANASFPGLWRLAGKHWRFGLEEMRDSLWRAAYLEKCRRYFGHRHRPVDRREVGDEKQEHRAGWSSGHAHQRRL